MKALENLASFKRYLDGDNGLLLVRGDMGPILPGMRAYNARHNIAPLAPDLEPAALELLCATALAAVSLAERESWGWSIAFPGKTSGFFVGVEPEGMMCIRARESDGDKALGMLQRQRPKAPMTQSYFEPRSVSPVDTIQQYFEEVEQTRTRLVVRGDGAGVLVHALPDGDFSKVSNLTNDALFDFVDDALEKTERKEVGEVILFYECRCSPEVITQMIDRMESGQRADLFGELAAVEVECPRCAREFTVRKNEGSPA